MRLLTHNYLQSSVNGTTKGYPLLIKAETLILEEAPLDRDMVNRILPKIDYSALKQACEQLSEACKQAEIELPVLPDTLPPEVDDALAANLFRVLFEIHVLEGVLVCPDTGREFPIKQGIPNMILHEDEL